MGLKLFLKYKFLITSSDWNSANIYLKCTNLLVYIFFANFGWFRKIKYTQNFILNDIRKNEYMLNKQKIHISQSTRKKYAQN